MALSELYKYYEKEDKTKATKNEEELYNILKIANRITEKRDK